MILLFIKGTLKFFFKEEYPRWYGPILEVLATFLLLATLWFTSKAYSPVALNQVDYFEYLLIGELVLHLPFSLLYQGLRLMKRIGLSNTADQLIVANRSILKMASSFLGVYFLKNCVRLILLFVLASLFFKAPFSLEQIPIYFLIVLLSSIPFVMLSLSLGSIVLFWGRGENIWGQVSSWMSFLSGAYFPLSIFPQWLQELLPFINPFALYLEMSRKALSSSSLESISGESFMLVGWTIFFGVCLAISYKMGLSKYRKSGTPNSYSF
jgi:ABC-type uncharacterized transport system permease subunit